MTDVFKFTNDQRSGGSPRMREWSAMSKMIARLKDIVLNVCPEYGEQVSKMVLLQCRPSRTGLSKMRGLRSVVTGIGKRLPQIPQARDSSPGVQNVYKTENGYARRHSKVSEWAVQNGRVTLRRNRDRIRLPQRAALRRLKCVMLDDTPKCRSAGMKSEK